jgi:hypothetical protein
MKQFCLGVVIAPGLMLPASAQGVDPLVGTWKLNLEKTTSSLPLDQRGSVTFAGEGQNFTNTAEGVNAQGQPYKIIFRHIYDGMPHPTTGNPIFDSTAYTRVGNTINAFRFRNGKAVLVGQAVIVPGKTYTFTQEEIDINNQPFHDVLVYDS